MKCHHGIAALFDLRGEEELSNWWKQSEESVYPVALCSSEDLIDYPDLKSEEGSNEQKYF